MYTHYLLLMLNVLFTVLQCVDAFTTYVVLREGGYETNPRLIELEAFLRGKLNSKAKWGWLVVAKAGSVLAMTFAVVAMEVLWFKGLVPFWGRAMFLVLMGCVVAFFMWVVKHNYLEYKKHRSS